MDPPGAPAWLDDLDLHAGPPEAAMGTRGLDVARWLLVDDEWEAQRAAARSLVATRRAEVVAGSAPAAAAEVLEWVDAWLRERHPSLVDAGPESAGDLGAIGDADPLVAARLRVAEDLCIVVDGTLVAGAVCFPSYWRLAEKVGRPLSAVHAPVPGYPGALAGRVDGFLARLRPGQGVWRRNWSIHPSATLFVPAHDPAPLPPSPADRWLRSEYQTLRRLGSVDAVVFTIRTQQVPLAALVSRPDICASLVEVLDWWTPAQRAYKGAAVDDALVDWLRATAGA